MKKLTQLVLEFGLLFSLTAFANATPAITVPETVGTGGAGEDSTRGWEFTTNQAIFVTDLGVFDTGLDGLAYSHQVGIFDSTGKLLTSATVPEGGTATLIDQFRTVAITPFELAAGQTYWIGAAYMGGNGDIQLYDSSQVTADPAITYLTGGVAFGSGLIIPNDISMLPGSVFGPNFDFVVAEAVPEIDGNCGTPILLVCLVLGIVTSRRKVTVTEHA